MHIFRLKSPYEQLARNYTSVSVADDIRIENRLAPFAVLALRYHRNSPFDRIRDGNNKSPSEAMAQAILRDAVLRRSIMLRQGDTAPLYLNKNVYPNYIPIGSAESRR